MYFVLKDEQLVEAKLSFSLTGAYVIVYVFIVKLQICLFAVIKD